MSEEVRGKLPKYVITADGYIGAFAAVDAGGFPVYRFDGGSRIADAWEIRTGCDTWDEAKKISNIRRKSKRPR